MTSSTLVAPLRTAMLGEFTAWADSGGETLGCGHGCEQIRSITGVPDGWASVAHLCAADRGCCFTLARRTAGGWALARTAAGPARTDLMRATSSLDDLYASVRFRPAPALWRHGVRIVERTHHRLTSGPYPLLTDWLMGTIGAMYDPVDEAAAQMLFVLSGDLRALPKVAA